MATTEAERQETEDYEDEDEGGGVAENVSDQAENLRDKASSNGGGSLLSSLTSKEVVIPIAASAAAAAAAFMAKKGPELLKDTVMPKLEEKGKETAKEATSSAAEGVLDKAKDSGGITGAAAGLVSKVTGKKDGAPSGTGKGRRLPIQRWTDVAAPVEMVYEQWTQFEEFPRIMHRVQSVQQQDDNKLAWEEKIWFSRRRWVAEIVDQRENERIEWKTVSGASHTGVVTFHELDDTLTRVLVNLDFQPSGLFEKMGSGLRFAKRAVQADLARFKAYVEMRVDELEEENSSGRSSGSRQSGRSSQSGSSSSKRSTGSNSRRSSGSNAKGDAERKSQRAQREARRQSRRQRTSAKEEQ
jgi:uncharacterized membrane protein